MTPQRWRPGGADHWLARAQVLTVAAPPRQKAVARKPRLWLCLLTQCQGQLHQATGFEGTASWTHHVRSRQSQAIGSHPLVHTTDGDIAVGERRRQQRISRSTLRQICNIERYSSNRTAAGSEESRLAHTPAVDNARQSNRAAGKSRAPQLQRPRVTQPNLSEQCQWTTT